jgi:sulfur relay (sulfurtransferase) complex TusBCD TusD component (DsrE family)
MKKLSLLVKSEPSITRAAMRFATASDEMSTPVECVFFFGKGVLHAKNQSKHFWSAWARRSGARLVLCSASAEVYGLKADDDFTVEGLGELIDAGLSSNKVVCFG